VFSSIRKLVIGTRSHLHNERTLTARFNKHRLLAGQLLLVLRRRIEAGEAGTVSWWDWYEANFASFRSRKDAEKIMKMAQADRAQQERTEARNVRRREARQERAALRAHACACAVERARFKPSDCRGIHVVGTRNVRLRLARSKALKRFLALKLRGMPEFDSTGPRTPSALACTSADQLAFKLCQAAEHSQH
jgi:hypothetical protein